MAVAVVTAGALAGAATRRSDSLSLVPPQLTAGVPRSIFLAIATGTVALLLVLAALVLTYMRPDETMPSGAPVRNGRHPLFVVLAVTLPSALIVGALVLGRDVLGGAEPPQAAGGPGLLPSTPDQPIGIDDVVLPLGAFVGVLIVASVIARRFVARRTLEAALEATTAGPSTESAALAEILDDGLDALVSEGDPRRAVIAAYARMERAMARRGWGRRAAEAPTEYVARVLSGVPEHGDDVGELTDLYVFAHFSDREITPGMREEAISAVRRLRTRAEGASDAG